MVKLITSIIFVAVILMGIIQGLFASMSISLEKFDNITIKFEKPMDTCDQLTENSIELSNTGLNVVIKNFVKFSTLESVNLEDNYIYLLSQDSFDDLPTLQCLNIRRNYVKNLFRDFLPWFYHKSLITLNLAEATGKNESRDTIISTNTYSGNASCYLPNVTHLDISGNNLIDLPIYLNTSFPRLTHLYLSNNSLDSSFLNRIPLTTLNLYLERNKGDIDITKLPKNINQLFLSNNNLLNITEFNHFENINTLAIRDCNISTSIISYLKKERLINLDMSSNNLSSIEGETFNGFEFIEHLSLDRCSIEKLDFLNELFKLKELSLAYNNIHFIFSKDFQNLNDLRILNLRGNNIHNMNINVFSNTMLIKLDLSENKLVRLPEFWGTELLMLKYLNLQSNQFIDIRDMFINDILSLQFLYVANNNFTKIPTSSLAYLPKDLLLHLSWKCRRNCPMLTEIVGDYI